MRVLVTGGAGYIGSHMVLMLAERGDEVTVLDDLSTGHADAVPAGRFVRGDVADVPATTRLLQGMDAVIHFAASSLVAESLAEPRKYYTRNVAGTAALLTAMRAASVQKLVFSSTAAVYGNPVRTPIDESHPTLPVNPYGATKLEAERMLAASSAAHGLRVVSLRYFNAAGADPQGRLGERHHPETHLIPLVLQAAAGRRASVSVYGNDYPTRDGTCVRDYVHVADLCDAHLRALEWLEHGHCDVFNLGNGDGATVMEVIDAARRVTGKPIKVLAAARRAGDPASLVADAAKARRVLGWEPRHKDIEGIVRDAWRWEQAQSR